ncbi:hypothetical protein BJV78DRAFT_124594 [Lactifluus subvellereus]|nr:hypothetical protein BJV78DRAFT_124594 [Lactifluus subvellereus]
MFEDSGACGGGKDSSTDDEGPAEAGVVFEGSSLVCTAGCLLVRLNKPSKHRSSHKSGLAPKWVWILRTMSEMLGLAWARSWVHDFWMSLSTSGPIGTL